MCGGVDVLESNGSSSMATVCAGSSALMDAGVPAGKHVAMGRSPALMVSMLSSIDTLGAMITRDTDSKATGAPMHLQVQMDITAMV